MQRRTYDLLFLTGKKEKEKHSLKLHCVFFISADPLLSHVGPIK